MLITNALNDDTRKDYLFLLLIVTISIGLRMYRLGQWSFWADEIGTLSIAQSFFENWSTDPRTALIEHPTTSLLINTALRVFGTSEWSARFAPAMLGLMSVPIFFLIAKRLFNARVGLFCSLMMAVSTWHLYWSQNVRFYVALLLFYTIALVLFYYGIEKDRPDYLVYSLIFLGFAFAERLLAIFYIPVVVSYLLALIVIPSFKNPPGLRWRNLAIIFMPGVILGVYFAWHFIRNPGLWASIYMVQTHTDLATFVVQFVSGVDVHIILLGCLGAFFLIRSRNRIGILLVLSAGLPPLIISGLSLFQFVHGRYAFITLTSWMLLAAVGIVELINMTPQPRKWMVAGILTAILLVISLEEDVSYFTNLNGGRPGWKDAYAVVEQQYQEDDVVISNGPTMTAHYFGDDSYSMMRPDLKAVSSILCDNNQRVWFVIGDLSHMDPQLFRWVQDNGRLLDDSMYRTYVYLFEPVEPSNQEQPFECYQKQ